VLAQWPLRYIRSYECSGRGRFALETGGNASHGAACYVLLMRPGHDSMLYDRIDGLVNELASLHGVSYFTLSSLLSTCIYIRLCLLIHSTRSLWLSNTNLISIPFVCSSFGAHSFSITAPTVCRSIWSSVPPALGMSKWYNSPGLSPDCWVATCLAPSR